MRYCLLVGMILIFSGCERKIELPNCVDTFSPKDYGRFLVNTTKGLAQHVSGSVWYRCVAGQTFRGRKCLGDPIRMTRLEAENYVQEFSEKTGETWRLPSSDEFKKLIETSCQSPAVNPNVFPNLPVDNFWTSDKSWHGDKFGCSVFSYRGSSSCRQASAIKLSVLLMKN